MATLKLLAKDTSIYGLGQVLKKIIGFALLPFYVRALSPAEYGVLDTLATAVFFLIVVFGIGIDGATGRYFFIAHNAKEKSKVLYTSIIIRVISNTIPVLLLLPFSSKISELLFNDVAYKWAVVITLLAIPIQSISKLQEVLFRYYRKPWKYLVVSLVRTVVNPVAGILLVVVLQWSVFGATLASLISSTVVMVFAYFYYTRRVFIPVFSKYWARKMLIFGYPLIFTGIMVWVNNVSDRFFLLKFASLDQIGLYSIANTFSQPLLLVNMALQMSSTVLVMSLFSKEKDNNKPETKVFLTKIWHIYLSIAVLIAMFISIFSYEIFAIVTTPDYIMGILALPFLLFGHILYQSMQITGNGMTLQEKSKPYFWIMLIAAGINVGLNFYFVPQYGFVGAAITTVISNFAYFIVAYFWSQNVFYIKRSFVKPMLFLMFGIALSIFFPFAQLKYNLEISIWYKVLVALGSLGLPFVFGLVKIDLLCSFFRQLRVKKF